MTKTPYQFLEENHPELKKQLEKHLLRGKVLRVMIDYAKQESPKL